MKCYLCGNSDFNIRSGSVRDNPDLKVMECNTCSLVTLNSTTHISERHYEDGGMHAEGGSLTEWIQETEIDDQRRFELLKEKIIGKKILDFGCGNGGFLKKAKPFTAKSEGIELEERVQGYFREINLTVWNSINSAVETKAGNYDLITAFHVFEHLSDPIEMLVKLSKLLAKTGEIIIEVPSSDDALLTLYESTEFANFTYWSQHLFLFNSKTMESLVNKSGLRLNWVKQVQRYSLSNHLYWISKGKPGGHKVWTFLNDRELNKAYECQLASVGKCDTILASIGI